MSLSNQDLVHMMQQKSRQFSKSINEALKKHDLYMSQWSILYCLHKFGAMTQKEIWLYLNVEAPTITRTLERMEKSEWIIREEGTDKRERIIRLTEKAKNEFSGIKQTFESVEQEFLFRITDKEKTQLYQLLQKIG